VTAALSLATTVSDVATVVLTRGVRAVQASRGRLLLASGDHPRRMAAATGSAQSHDSTVHGAACGADEVLGEADARAASRLDRGRQWAARTTPPADPPSHSHEAQLALPLVHGETS
jgi:hypothetical protein